MTAQAPYRLVIFDFDGTLADSFGWFLGALDQLAERHRFRRLPREELERLRGLDARGVIRELGVSWWRLAALARGFRKLAARDLAGMRLFEGVAPMLHRLAHAGLALGIVSTNSEANVRAVLGPAAELIDYFDCGDGMFRKRFGLRRLLRRSTVGRSQALYIGDEIRDYQAARAAGIAFGAVSWGFTRPDALRALRPALVFDTVEEIVPRLLGTASRQRP